ncbi:MAG: zinc-ribbon domain-containing protein, partial [Eubacteriales bacterium]|nr:zinc-ribbon domain-containing protein [Eubacteriales bacterium]
MFCAKCGSQMADDAAFCPACGAKNVEIGQKQPLPTNHQAQQINTPQNFYQPQQSYQQVQQQYSPVQKPDQRKNRQTLIIIAAVVAVLLIVAVLATV